MKPGVFLGNAAARVRDSLWKMACERIKEGNVLQIWSTRSEQGFAFRQYGMSPRFLQEFEGLALLTVAAKPESSFKDVAI